MGHVEKVPPEADKLQFRFTTHAERAKSFVLEVGARLVQ